MPNSSNSHFIAEDLKDQSIHLMPDSKIDCLYVIWNKHAQAEIEIDGKIYPLEENCILFISEFHMEVKAHFHHARVIHFDKTFLGIDTSLNQAGDYLLVFYGYHFLNSVPKIKLSKDQTTEFEQLWALIVKELPLGSNSFSKPLVQNSFQRLMLLSQKIHVSSEFDLHVDYMDLRVIREFQYLVETNFKQLTKVSEYAQVMRVAPKRISELFSKHYHRKPSDLITHRRNVYAKKQLMHTRELIKNIAYELNFSDSQSFSHFFKKHNEETPEQFRTQHS